MTIAAAIGALTSFYAQYQEAIGAVQRVFQWLEMPSPIADPPHPVPLPKPIRGDVEFRDVRFRYHTAKDDGTTLDQLSLRIRPG